MPTARSSAQGHRHRRHQGTRLDGADAAVLTEYRGLTVTQIADLRAALRPAATDYKIFKNTLARRAAKDAGLDDLVDTLEGPVAIAFVRKDGGDAVTAAKALRDFAKANPNLVVKGGMLGTAVLTTPGRRGPRRRAAPRRSCSPGSPVASRPRSSRRRPVPGVHPQLRLRPQGPHRPTSRRRRGARRRREARRRAPTRRSRRPEDRETPADAR